jgi:excisionase family DNA binding protein
MKQVVGGERLLLTPEEAAEALAIGRSKLYELLAAGALRSVRIGGCRRVPLVALKDFVASLATDPGDAAQLDAS